MRAPWRRIKPGWYVLAALTIYAVVATSQWRLAALAVREAHLAAAGPSPSGPAVSGPAGSDPVAAGAGAPDPVARTEVPVVAREGAASAGLWWPIPGVRVPSDDTHLPGALRTYRSGVSQGFVFRAESSGVPIVYGTPVIAAADGVVVRVDEPYAELGATEWNDLVARVADGADDRDLDMLRGRQVWVRLDDGRVLRYGHLASVRSGVSVGARVTRGRVLGTVGNSGTTDGVARRTTNPRLHFEVWDGDDYFGAGLEPDEIRLLAADVFVGP